MPLGVGLRGLSFGTQAAQKNELAEGGKWRKTNKKALAFQ